MKLDLIKKCGKLYIRYMRTKGFTPALVVVAILAIFLGGYYLGQQQIKLTLSSQSTVQPPSSPADETADWKTYISTKYGYSLKYPINWKSLECNSASFGPDVASSCATDAPGALILTVENEIKEPLISVATEFKVTERKTVNIGGENGEWVLVEKVKPSPGADKIIVTAVVHDGKTYTFNLSDVNEKENLDQILSTFKFTQ